MNSMKLFHAENHNNRIRTLLCVLALVVLFFLLILRVPYGYDWTDEQYYSEVAYRLLQGDRPLVDTWEVHQFSAMISAPVLQVYLFFHNGSTDGAILFLRYFYICLQFAVSLAAFLILQNRNGKLPALFAAAMILAFTHFSINSYYYDTMALLFTVLSALFVIQFLKRSKASRFFAFLAGASFALAVLAFPYFVFGTIVYLIFWLLRIRQKAQRKQNRIGALCFLSGAVLIALSVAVYLLSNASIAQILQGLRNIMSDPDHQSESLLLIMKQYFNTIRVVFSPVSYGAAALLVLGVAYICVKRDIVRRILKTLGVVGTVLLLFGSVIAGLTYPWNGIYRINLLAAAFALSAPGLYFFAQRKDENGTLLMYFLGCALSIMAQIGSNTRFSASSGMLLPASVATVLFLFDHRSELRFLKKLAWFNALTTTACVFCVAGLMSLRMVAVHRDEPVRYLNTVLESGAAKGIRTTKESAVLHAQLIADIRENAPKEGSILVTYLFPEGYLVTGLKAATPSTFNMNLDSAWLKSYYVQNPEREPAYVFSVDPDIQYNNSSLAGKELYSDNSEYQMMQTETGIAFVRKTPAAQ